MEVTVLYTGVETFVRATAEPSCPPVSYPFAPLWKYRVGHARANPAIEIDGRSPAALLNNGAGAAHLAGRAVMVVEELFKPKLTA